MGMSLALFMAMWIAMMVAMMLPTAAPMIMTFAAVQAGKGQESPTFVPTWVFVSAYLVIWTAFGALAYAAVLGADALAGQTTGLAEHAGQIAGVLFAVAGVYQLTPLKRVCLSKCRAPWTFIMTSWRDGYGGAFRMGLQHGLYCLGCCWALFVVLFPLGIMNVVAMLLITALIFAEKSLPFGPRVARGAALVLAAYGALLIAMPWALPGALSPGMDSM